ncbi:MAG: type II secretion system protein [Patescibacteria group bacterium]|nr:type II secretion system protein [Patescibacteria group bacterium]
MRKSGFTLIEIIVVIMLLGFAVTLFTNFVVQGYKANLFGKEQDLAVQNGRKATEQIAEEIREATQSDRGDYSLDVVAEQNLSFYSNIDSDDDIEKVRYFLNGSIFKKGIIEPSGDPIVYTGTESIIDVSKYINNQSEAIFIYYDTDNNVIADPTTNKNDIRLIRVSLKINVTPEIAPQDYYVEMNAQIRNLKDNL